MRYAGAVLYVDDVPGTMSFYQRAFGFKVRFYDEALGFVELESSGATLSIASHSIGEMLMPGAYLRPADGRPAAVEVGFFTDDVPAAFAKVVAEGGTPIAAPKRMPWGLKVAYLRAPEGTMIGLSEPPPATV